jgi:IclR family acetate operon transcriptional repressor
MDGKVSVDGGRGEAEGVRAVERAVDILQAFSPARPSMSVVELQRVLGLSRPTLYRLLQTLASKGLIRADGEPQRFSLGPGIMSLAHVWMSRVDVAQLARPILERLRDETAETAALFVLRDDKRLCVLELTSPHPLAISRGMGETEHISRGASGKAILAHALRDKGLADSFWRTLPEGSDRERLLEDLARTREDGFAISRSEKCVGAVAIAAPFFDHSGQVAGSIGLFAPEARLGEERIPHSARLVTEAARRLSEELGYVASSGSPAKAAASARAAAATSRTATARRRGGGAASEPRQTRSADTG